MRTVNEALKIAQQVTGYELKDYQQQAIEAYLCGKDVFVSAPTRLRAVSLMLRNRRTVSGEAAMRERRRRDRQTAKQTAGAPLFADRGFAAYRFRLSISQQKRDCSQSRED